MCLNNLRVHYRPEGGLPRQVKQRPATVADLVAALIAEGGEIVEARQEERGWRPLMRVQEPGRYLIYLIPKGDKE